MNKDEQNYLLENLAGIFIRSFFFSVALLLVSMIFYALAGNWSYYMSSSWYKIELSKHEYDLIFYCGLAFVKTCAIIFFLLPYVAIKLVVRKNRKNI
jgi:hypothetical protein